jgi:Spy/CpxP family protein refolding chaperone
MTFLPLAALLLAAATQPVGPGPAQRGSPPPGDEAFRMVDAYILSNMQESLGLTDEQYTRLLPLVKRLHNDRREFAQRRRRAFMELRRLLEAGGGTEDQVVQALRALKAVETEEPAALRRDLDAIDAALSPVQQGKYRVMEAEVERKIREIVRQIRMQRAGPRDRRGQPPRPQ